MRPRRDDHRHPRATSDDRPLVSAIIPTYDRPEECLRAIESVEAQTYDRLELVVVETPSGDGTDLATRLDGLTSYPTTHVETAPDVGVSEARNIGIDRANGTYLAFLDDDDEWRPEKTETQVERLESAPEQVQASVSGNVKIGPDGQRVSTYTPPHLDDVVAYQLCWNIGTFSMLTIHEEVCRVVGNTDEALDRREDQDFLLRIAQAFEFDIVDQPLVRKHVGRDDHLGQDYDAGKAANEVFREKHAALAEELDMRAEMEDAFEFSLGRAALSQGKYARARRHFLRSLSRGPFDRGKILHFAVSLGGPITYRLGRWVDQLR